LDFLNTLEKYYQNGLLLKQTHPTYDLTIWNYSPMVQYDRLWDDITIQCRGLVTNSKGEIVARPFKKFFNYEEHKPEDLPNENFEVYEKMDGSLGILFYYEEELTDERRYNIWFNNNYETGMEKFFNPNDLPDFDNPYYEPTPKTKGEWILATRGSFTSTQAIKGRELLEKYDYNRLVKDYTYLFEIIYPENRIVCNYDFEDLVLLGMIHTKSGNEVNIHYDDNQDIRIKNLIRNLNLKIVTLYKTWGEGYDLLKEEISDDREGYVIRFKNGFRMKIKGKEYIRLHKILTNISNRDIWEYLKDNKPFNDLLDKVPDEFYNWVSDTADHLVAQYGDIEKKSLRDFSNIIKNINGNVDRKTFALEAMKCQNPSILFSILDSKNYQETIWKLIYPPYSKPFKKDEN
jgi:RNA ligase